MSYWQILLIARVQFDLLLKFKLNVFHKILYILEHLQNIWRLCQRLYVWLEGNCTQSIMSDITCTAGQKFRIYQVLAFVQMEAEYTGFCSCSVIQQKEQTAYWTYWSFYIFFVFSSPKKSNVWNKCYFPCFIFISVVAVLYLIYFAFVLCGHIGVYNRKFMR